MPQEKLEHWITRLVSNSTLPSHPHCHTLTGAAGFEPATSRWPQLPSCSHITLPWHAKKRSYESFCSWHLFFVLLWKNEKAGKKDECVYTWKYSDHLWFSSFWHIHTCWNSVFTQRVINFFYSGSVKKTQCFRWSLVMLYFSSNSIYSHRALKTSPSYIKRNLESLLTRTSINGKVIWFYGLICLR